MLNCELLSILGDIFYLTCDNRRTFHVRYIKRSRPVIQDD